MDSHKIYRRNTRKYGRGIFAKNPIKKGERIASFDGTIFDDAFDDWTEDLLQHAIQFARDKWRDSNGMARWINHSCNPNCGIKNLFDVVAMRDIAAGEEITWDYEMTEKSDWWRMKCRCGYNECRKVIGNHANMPQHVRRKYKGFISDWLVKKSRRSKSNAKTPATRPAAGKGL